MAKSVLAGWKKAVIYNPETGDRVQVSRISAASSELPGDPNIRTETAAGQVWGGQIWPLTVAFMDSDGLDLLEDWQANETPVHIIVFAPAGKSILFRENETIDFIRGTVTNAREGLQVHQVSIEAVGADLDVQSVKNLALTIPVSSSQGAFVFPIAGAILTLSATYANPDDAEMEITAKNYSGDVLAVTTEPVTAGRNSADIILPPGTWTVEIDLLASGSGSVSDISLAGDGSQEFINY